jgi:hypothetical protein
MHGNPGPETQQPVDLDGKPRENISQGALHGKRHGRRKHGSGRDDGGNLYVEYNPQGNNGKRKIDRQTEEFPDQGRGFFPGTVIEIDINEKVDNQVCQTEQNDQTLDPGKEGAVVGNGFQEVFKKEQQKTEQGKLEGDSHPSRRSRFPHQTEIEPCPGEKQEDGRQYDKVVQKNKIQIIKGKEADPRRNRCRQAA